jgi:hypothetical protein
MPQNYDSFFDKGYLYGDLWDVSRFRESGTPTNNIKPIIIRHLTITKDAECGMAHAEEESC